MIYLLIVTLFTQHIKQAVSYTVSSIYCRQIKKGLRINAALGRKLTNFLAGGIYYTKSSCTDVDLKAEIQALLLRRVTTPNMVRPRPSSIRAFGSGTDAVLAENVRIGEGSPASCAVKDQTAAVVDKVLVRSEK